MKFQNPSLNFFFERTHEQTHGRTDKLKAICSPLFKVGGIKMCKHVQGMIQNNVDFYYHFYTVQFIVNKIT